MKSAKAKAYEKRHDLRIPIQLKVDVESPNDHYLFEYSSNLSESGIFIQTTEPLHPGTLVNIQFSLPDNYRIRTRGEVIWVNMEDEDECGMGVKFQGLQLDDRNRILMALKKLAVL
jgi:type IV pilus assembly protein PilZ